MDIGIAIRTIRKERNIKQHDLAVSAGITPMHLSQVELGKKQPSHDLLVRIALVLHVSVGYLYFRALDRNDFPAHKQLLYNALYPTMQHIMVQLM